MIRESFVSKLFVALQLPFVLLAVLDALVRHGLEIVELALHARLVAVEVDAPICRFFLDRCPLFLREELGEGDLQRAEESDPLDDFELLSHSFVSFVNMAIAFRVAAEPAVAVHEDSLEAKLDTLPETDFDPA